ncbi:TIGR03086 family metal-binding protein [Dactylosporangium sp. CA-139066]|uniref:TIGR03086 family metal-binding protein n=1 Tax=Dactylosporangium sp. CA-139066 TaxID=3239930 RepID=UPI003D93123D
MQKHVLLGEAAAGMLAVVDRIGAQDLGTATPCAEWDVAALRDHLLEWGPALEGAARKEAVGPGAAYSSLREQVTRLAEAWGEPAAWDGMTRMGGAELPADLVGGMVLGEFVLHGWDLGRALGVPVEFGEDVLRLMYAEVARSADQGRSMGVYGAEVPVPPDAPLLARTLALSGRDPQWSA